MHFEFQSIIQLEFDHFIFNSCPPPSLGDPLPLPLSVLQLISLHMKRPWPRRGWGNLWFVLAIGCNVNWITLPTIYFPRRGPQAFKVKCNQLYSKHRLQPSRIFHDGQGFCSYVKDSLDRNQLLSWNFKSMHGRHK